MTSREFPSGSESSKPFDPATLDRAVIAIPLLKAIDGETEVIKWALEKQPVLLEQYNFGVIYDPAFPNTRGGAHRQAVQLMKAAQERTGDTAPDLRIEAPQNDPDIGLYSYARLRSRIVRKMLALNADLDPAPIKQIMPTLFEVIIDLNLDHPGGREAARQWVVQNIEEAKRAVPVEDEEQRIHARKSELNRQYVFARLEGRAIKELVRLDAEQAAKAAAKASGEGTGTHAAKPKQRSTRAAPTKATLSEACFRAIHRIWPDFRIRATITKSLATVKADAAHASFSANGTGITWAIMDSGIDADHPHFQLHQNLDRDSPLHADFTDPSAGPAGPATALTDRFGHGTHVAGIIAGEQRSDGPASTVGTMRAVLRSISGYAAGQPPKIETNVIHLEAIRGVAPRARLVSLKVLDEDGHGEISNLIAAITHIQERNGYGRRILVHGVNISLGYEFDPEWFACGQSPLCVEINRLVRSGVVVVVSAGNTGYGVLGAQQRATNAGLEVTINDPGNADLAITVGSTHRDMPHVYGVSYFSSKGPTGDGRPKPDLVAPGERILSCATGQLKRDKAKSDACDYVEDSGTSMAAPHVSGAVAAFLSVRREFIGEPEKVKTIFVATATDLKRDRYYQGAGLLDLMRAIQSV